MRSVDIKAALQYHVFGCPGIANVLATGRLGEECWRSHYGTYAVLYSTSTLLKRCSS